MAYGVIGNTTVSGTVILGSSPGRPATGLRFCVLMPRSSSGLGRRPLTAVTRVQIPYGVQVAAGGNAGCFFFSYVSKVCSLQAVQFTYYRSPNSKMKGT